MASLKTITQFKSRLAGGGARPNLFEVNINDFKYADAWDNETFQFLVRLLHYQHLQLHQLKFLSEEEF